MNDLFLKIKSSMIEASFNGFYIHPYVTLNTKTKKCCALGSLILVDPSKYFYSLDDVQPFLPDLSIESLMDIASGFDGDLRPYDNEFIQLGKKLREFSHILNARQTAIQNGNS